MITIILLALTGTIIAGVIGTVWYMPNTPMGKLNLQYLGFDKLTPEEQQRKMEEGKATMPKLYGAQMVLSFLTAFATVFIISMSVQNGVPFMMAVGFVIMNWLCFMVPVIGSGIIWGNCDRAIAGKKFLSDISSNLVILLAVAGLTGLFL